MKIICVSNYSCFMICDADNKQNYQSLNVCILEQVFIVIKTNEVFCTILAYVDLTILNKMNHKCPILLNYGDKAIEVEQLKHNKLSSKSLINDKYYSISKPCVMQKTNSIIEKCILVFNLLFDSVCSLDWIKQQFLFKKFC